MFVEFNNPINVPEKNPLLDFRVLVEKYRSTVYILAVSTSNMCCTYVFFQPNLNLFNLINLLGIYVQRGKPGISRGHGSAGETSMCQRLVFYLIPYPSFPKNHKVEIAGASE